MIDRRDCCGAFDAEPHALECEVFERDAYDLDPDAGRRLWPVATPYEPDERGTEA